MALRIFLFVGLAASLQAQPPLDTHAPVPLQPLAQHVRRLETALAYLGQPLLDADQTEINAAIGDSDEIAAVNRLERVLDKYTLATVEINPESRVKVEQGAAKPDLVEGGARLFLVKVLESGARHCAAESFQPIEWKCLHHIQRRPRAAAEAHTERRAGQMGERFDL